MHAPMSLAVPEAFASTHAVTSTQSCAPAAAIAVSSIESAHAVPTVPELLVDVEPLVDVAPRGAPPEACHARASDHALSAWSLRAEPRLGHGGTRIARRSSGRGTLATGVLE
jgi:hypothetical protein